MLHWAAASGDADLLAYLLERAVDVDGPAYSGQTPLHVAAGAGHERAVRLLLSDSARPDLGARMLTLRLYLLLEICLSIMCCASSHAFATVSTWVSSASGSTPEALGAQRTFNAAAVCTTCARLSVQF